MGETFKLSEDASFNTGSLKTQNEVIAARIKSFNSLMLQLTTLPNYPFAGMAPEIVHQIEKHADDARKQL